MEYERLLETPTNINTSPHDAPYTQVIDPGQAGATQCIHNRLVHIGHPDHRSRSGCGHLVHY